jgi:serine/threonine protein kinase
MGQQNNFQMPFRVGQILAEKYEILELIGVGGIGFVVAATHIDLGEKVALKFLRPDALSNAEAVGRFAREARASVQIKSEHVARVFDVGHLPDGEPFIVMEYLEGQDLGAVIDERGALPIKVAVEYLLQACEALASAHARGVVHRDVKPENLFLNRPARGMDVIKVLDFGISKVALTGSSFEDRHPLAQTTMAMGSPTYMSPEQVRASHDIDARTDIWSLGCVLYELLTGLPAFDAPSLTQISAAILEREPASLRVVCPMAPPGLEAVVKHCLAKDPLGRFQNVGELALALYPYGPQRGQLSVERCCSLLRSAGIAVDSFEPISTFPLSLPDLDQARASGLDVVPSTPTVESPMTFVPASATPTRKWFAALGLLGLAALASAVVAVRSSSEPTAQLVAPAVEHGSARQALATNSAPGPASALPEPPGPPPDEPAVVPPPEPAAPATAAPATISPPPDSAPGSAAASKQPIAALPATARRRPSAPAPKLKPAASPRPITTVAGEADVGF